MSEKPSEKEEEYFARKEYEKRRLEAQKRDAARAAEERERLRQLHWMRCPKCGMELLEIEFKGVKVDKCSGCDGVFLDAGEMDSILGGEGKGLHRLLRAFR